MKKSGLWKFADDLITITNKSFICQIVYNEEDKKLALLKIWELEQIISQAKINSDRERKIVNNTLKDLRSDLYEKTNELADKALELSV